MAQGADQASVTRAIHSVAATTAGFMAPTSRTEIALDVFLKRDDITEESKRNLLIDNTARFYGL
jgi:hypothetical protein